jgi:hypothetical protein
MLLEVGLREHLGLNEVREFSPFPLPMALVALLEEEETRANTLTLPCHGMRLFILLCSRKRTRDVNAMLLDFLDFPAFRL